MRLPDIVEQLSDISLVNFDGHEVLCWVALEGRLPGRRSDRDGRKKLRDVPGLRIVQRPDGRRSIQQSV